MKVWQLAYPHNLQHVSAPDLKLTDDKVKVKVTKALITESDKTYIMLVSDGLYSEIKESDIKKLLNSDKTVEAKAQSLVDLANKKGGRDNITVVLAEI